MLVIRNMKEVNLPMLNVCTRNKFGSSKPTEKRVCGYIYMEKGHTHDNNVRALLLKYFYFG